MVLSGTKIAYRYVKIVVMALLLSNYILSTMVSIIDKFLQDLKINGAADKTLKDYSRFLKNIDKLKSLEKWDKTDVNRYIMEKQEECLIETVDISKVKLKRFFTWVGKSELVSHLNPIIPGNTCAG